MPRREGAPEPFNKSGEFLQVEEHFSDAEMVDIFAIRAKTVISGALKVCGAPR
jgi:hypothetical protein